MITLNYVIFLNYYRCRRVVVGVCLCICASYQASIQDIDELAIGEERQGRWPMKNNLIFDERMNSGIY
jgi:hypothetical protein